MIDSKLETSATLPTLYAAEWIRQHDAIASEWVCRFVEHAATQLRQGGRRVETHIFEGNPKEILREQAQRGEVDCIFIGARGLDHGDQCYLGTTAGALAARAHCSVEVVRR